LEVILEEKWRVTGPSLGSSFSSQKERKRFGHLVTHLFFQIGEARGIFISFGRIGFQKVGGLNYY